MSSSSRRSPMFYCYECNAEMRPLMVPDPHCASCNGTFVEEIPSDNAAADDPEHDPRNFQQDLFDGHDHEGHVHAIPGQGPFAEGGDPIVNLMNMLMSSIGGPGGPSGGGGGGGGRTIRVDMNGGRGRFIFTSGGGGGGGTLGSIIPGPIGVGGPIPMSGGAPQHPLEGLLAFLGGRPMAGSGSGGQWGDYALDQHGLDEIITRLMEQNQGARPVPAPEDMIAKLPRQKVAANSPLTEKECAVCKDTFEPTNEVITLPCSENLKFQHTFHEDCILPWLQQNGTCPVCRFQLVPQPEHHAPPPVPDLSTPGPGNRGGPGGSAPPNGFSGFWDMFSRGRPTGPSTPGGSSPSGGSGTSGNPSQRRPDSNGPPGGWDHLD